MTEQVLQKCRKYQEHFSSLFNVACHVINIPDNDEPAIVPYPQNASLCDDAIYEKLDLFSTCMYGCNEANRWNGRYIFYCPLGLVFIATSIINEYGALSGGIVLGPIVMGEHQDIIDDLAYPELEEPIMRLKSFTTQDVHHISEILACVTSEIAGVDEQKFRNMIYNQERILKEIYRAKDGYDDSSNQNADSILSYEKDLRAAVLRGEKNAALDMLNEVLAHVYVYSNYDINSVKARMLELLVMLSRATIEAGADTNDVFRLSEGYIRQIEGYNDIDQLAVWISVIIRRFIIQAFDLAQVKHSDVVFKVTNYIKKNCGDKLSLDTLAREVYLSKSYLSSIFKEETGIGLTEYIKNVRIEKSKKLLTREGIAISEIALLCGFKDQSYFSKVFKKETGISPKKFRKNYFGV